METVRRIQTTTPTLDFDVLTKALPKRARRTLVLTLLFLLTLVFVSLSNRPLVLKAAYLVRYTRDHTSANGTGLWQDYREWLESLANDKKYTAAFHQIPFAEESFFDLLSNLVGTLHFAVDHQFQRQPYVSNGYIGARIPNLGHGFAMDTPLSNDSEANNTLNGWPLFDQRFAGAFVAGFYNLQANTTKTNFPWLLQYGGESVISVVPQWTYLALSKDNYTLDPALSQSDWGSISEYSQTLSLNSGRVHTLFLWLDKYYVEYEVMANRAMSSLGTVTVSITNPTSGEIEVNFLNALDFDTSFRLSLVNQSYDGTGIYQVYSPEGVMDAFGATYATLTYDTQLEISTTWDQTDTQVLQNATLKVPAASKVVVNKLVGILTSDLDPQVCTSADSVLEAARTECLSHKSYSDLESSNDSEWQKLLGQSLSIEFPDDPLLTLTSRASIYHLLANTRPEATGVTAALGVTGLSSDSYGGMVFWDTDLWMLSALLPYAPLHSRSLVNYRLFTHDQAKQNLLSPLNTLDITDGAAYPWTSGRYGNCTATGPCFDYEYHLNAAIAFSAWKLYLEGSVGDDYLDSVAFPLISDAALFFSQYVKYNDTLGKYVTKNLTDPDEYANHIDNGAYTNAAIVSTLNIAQAVYTHLGKTQPKAFADIASNIYIPRSEDDENIILEYSGMPASVEVKQADVVMLTYPLEYGLDEMAAKENMKYYSMKQSSFGPAMTWPIFSAVSSIVLDSGCSSQSYLLKAVKPFLRGPYAQFSEQNDDDFIANNGTHPAFPFLTASGGFIQAVHGLFGLKYDYDVQDGKLDRFIRVDPAKLANLPNGVYLDGIKYMNLTLSMNLTDSGLQVTNHGLEDDKQSSNTTVRIQTSSRLGSLDYYVGLGETVDLSIYIPAQSLNNSLTECRNSIFSNITQGLAGDVLASINDGDNSTYWQAETANTSKILVDLLYNKTIRGCMINWGEMPPSYVTIKTTTSQFNTQYPFVDLTDALLSQVSFSPDDNKMMNETAAFNDIYSANITISEPYDEADYDKIIPLDSYNTTSFDFSNSSQSRFVLVEFGGLITPNKVGGAKIYDLNFT